jgi:hypothetical protein
VPSSAVLLHKPPESRYKEILARSRKLWKFTQRPFSVPAQPLPLRQ